MEERKVYVGRKSDGTLVTHTNIQAMRDIDGVNKPAKVFALEEFEAAGGIVREINGQIVLGKTEAEMTAENNQSRIVEIDRELEEINHKQARSSAEIANALANGNTPGNESVTFHRTREQRAATLRQERARLLAS